MGNRRSTEREQRKRKVVAGEIGYRLGRDFISDPGSVLEIYEVIRIVI